MKFRFDLLRFQLFLGATQITNKMIEEHISDLKKPYVPDFGMEEEINLVR